MSWTESQIKQVVKKYDSVEVYRELDDKEIVIEVFYDYHEAESSYFDHARGEGHPGSPSEIEIILALGPDKNPVELSEQEQQAAEDKIRDELSSEEDDDFDIEFERE